MRRAVAVVAALLALAGGAQAGATDASQEPLQERLPTEAAGEAAEDLASATSSAASGAGSAAGALASGLAAAADLAAGVLAAGGEALAAGLSAVAAGWAAASDGLSAAAGLASAAGAAVAAGLVHGAAALVSAAVDLAVAAVRDVASSPAHQREAALRSGAGSLASAAAWSGYRAGLRQGMLAPLYSRIGRDELLEHDVRRAIYDYVDEHPGAHVSEIAEAVDLGWGTAVYHLERLASAEILVSEESGNHKCFFRNGEVSAEAREAIPVLKNEKARNVVAFVRENPAASQKEVAEALGMSAALVSWHVSRLADSGLLEKERQGRGNALYVDDATAGPAMRAATA